MGITRTKIVAKAKKTDDGFLTVVHLRGTAEYREWFEEFRKSQSREPSSLARYCLKLAAEREGFRPPPER